uniref:Uncharacterized protein n=1 Tax=Helianthus annuus TaxID=4232 RepID=A0A251VSF8_HELAN
MFLAFYPLCFIRKATLISAGNRSSSKLGIEYYSKSHPGRVWFVLVNEASSIHVHNVSHVSNLKKCLSDETLIVPLKELTIDEQLHFVEEPVEITDWDVKVLKNTRILLV